MSFIKDIEYLDKLLTLRQMGYTVIEVPFEIVEEEDTDIGNAREISRFDNRKNN